MVQSTLGPADAEVVNAARQLLGRLQDEPLAIAQIQAIIALELETPLNDDTYGSLGRRFRDHLGEDAATFLLSALIVNDLETELSELLGQETAALEQLIRPISFLRALYRDRLQQAQMAWREIPDDWTSVYREVQYDALSSIWKYGLLIDKYNGERVTLRGPATSIVTLTSQVLKIVTSFPDPTVILHDRLVALVDDVKQFEEWAKPALSEVDGIKAPKPRPARRRATTKKA